MVTFSNSQRANNDTFTFSEDQLLSAGAHILLNVLANDASNRGLYSVDDGVGPLPPADLLIADPLSRGISAWDYGDSAFNVDS